MHGKKVHPRGNNANIEQDRDHPSVDIGFQRNVCQYLDPKPAGSIRSHRDMAYADHAQKLYRAENESERDIYRRREPLHPGLSQNIIDSQETGGQQDQNAAERRSAASLTQQENKHGNKIQSR